MKSLAIIAGSALIALSSPAFSAECFGRTELDAVGDPGAQHPNFPFKVYFSSMTALIAGNQGVVSNLECRTSSGAKKIDFDVSAHITYKCEGYVADDYSVKMDCDGSNTSKNKVGGRLIGF